MDIRRVILFGALGLVMYSLWNNWQQEHPALAPHTQTPVVEALMASSENQLLPDMKDNQSSAAEVGSSNKITIQSTQPTISSKIVHVVTDVLDVDIDLNQGDVVAARLRDYPSSVQDKNTPITLLQNNATERYVANSSVFVVQNQDIKTLQFNFHSSQPHYELTTDQTHTVVSLTGQNANGLSVIKRFNFERGSYLIHVDYELENKAQSDWKGYINTQLLRTSPEEDKSSMFHVGSFTGASYSYPGKHRYQKVTFKEMSKANLDETVLGGWIAMQQHYFLSAWVPDPKVANRFYTRASGNDFTIGSISPSIELKSQQKQTVSTSLYIGPEVASVLSEIAPGLDLTVDYGWLWFLSSILFSVMTKIHSVVGNWGWSIVLVTLLIKLAFYKLSATSYKSMANMRRLQPKLAALKARYGDDKAKMSQATMEFYREEKVNPLGGCLPILIQIPVFIALYWVLIESVELRQAPFILWIRDLASADPYHVLPIIMGATMLIQQRLNPAPPDPMQAKIMMFLPVFFTALFWGFPAGLVLYWIVNNSLSILQQWYITRKYSVEKPNHKKISAK